MKIEIHIYHHNVFEDKNIYSCDLAINNGSGDISYHDWNVKHSGKCADCKGKKIRNKLIKR